MNDFDRELSRRLDVLRNQDLFRELRRVDGPQSTRVNLDGQRLLNFSSNDYLGLANDPALKAAAAEAVERFGAGAGASRLVCGSLAPHHELEETLAEFKGVEAALSFSSGYATALGAICAVLGPEDVIVLDRLVHACIVDAARLCGAKIRVFKHNEVADLEKILRWAVQSPKSTVGSPKSKVQSLKSGAAVSTVQSQRRVLVVTESVFSMDGDMAPLREMVALKEQYGAWLMVDEAHATGLYGVHRRGLAEELGIGERIEIQMGTLGKAIGAAGGYICGSRTLAEYLRNRARSFIFSTAPVPAAAAAATAGIRLIQSAAGEERCRRLWDRISELNWLKASATGQGHSGPDALMGNARQAESAGEPEKERLEALLRNRGHMGASAIIPIMVGEEALAVRAAAKLRAQGIFIPAIRYPTVARGQARLRLTLTANHTHSDIAKLAAALGKERLLFSLPLVRTSDPDQTTAQWDGGRDGLSTERPSSTAPHGDGTSPPLSSSG